MQKWMCVLAVVLAAAGPAAADPVETAKTVGRGLGKVPLASAKEVMSVIDRLTAKTSPIATRVHGTGRRPQEQLLFEQEGMEVTLERHQDNWRGTVTVEVTVPIKATYGIDLRQLDRAAMRYDADRRLLRLKAPEAEVVAVEPDLAHLAVRPRYSGCRFRLTDDDTAQQLQLDLLRDDYPAAARAHAEAQRDGLRDRARQRLAEHIRRVLELAGVDVAAEVE
jgi:hypothetical protein